MKQPHVILRAIGGAAARDTFLGARAAGAAAAAEPTAMAVEVEDLDQPRLTATMRKRDVVAVAPAMPMKLIEPVGGANAQPAAAGVAWGVKAVAADASPFSGDGIVVAVLDTGIDATHAAFAGVTLVQQNFTSDAAGDQHGHGTHCAGTIFGRDVAGTRIGVARGVKKALIGKVLGTQGGGSDAIVQAIQWAIQGGANVISMSLGMDFPGFQKQLVGLGFPPELATSRALEGYRANVLLFERLASMVRSMGAFVQPTVIVAAAGNESRTDQNPDFKIAVSPPAVADGIVSVAALQQASGGFGVASFSNTGALVSGPGVAITSAKLGGGLVGMNGTSMAAPHVAGVAALWAEKLKAVGPLGATLLSAKLVASGATSGLQAGFDPADVGSGMVTAPQS